ncbi:MBL fold metallo-hydrolase [uncultured Flavonifractor sp.]|uniref:MBL fold metallo-hydrolase n=1 Tax=uncultured Flavonifractor sp. TaxID=1193534 RepID=UPI002618C6E6|nr:MBL fold metallo-hydrolase [uncultured Flavonifractor sp.]
MPEQIIPNLYRIPVPLPGNPLKELNAYLIRGKDRPLLVDTGFRQEPCRQALFAQLKELGLRPGEVDVLLTHLHSDHSGLAPEAAGERGVIYISAVDRPTLDCTREEQAEHWAATTRRFAAEGFPPELLRDMASTNPARSMAPPEGGHYESLVDGQVLEAGGFRLRALLMPGHTPGQMCFWVEGEGLLLLGDHVLFDITPNITSWPQLPDALGAYLDSLDRIRNYVPVRSLPGHRGGGALVPRVDALKEHHRLRLEEAYQAVKNHPGAGAYELAGYMTWKIRAGSWAEFPVAQKWFAVGECMSHLDHLMVQGRITRKTEEGLNRYQAG